MEVKVITTENFETEVLQADKTVLVDFWADWCMPCRMLSPVVDQIAEERPDIIVGKINVDDQVALAQKYAVATIPTLLVFKNGEVVDKTIGVVPKEAIMDMIK